MTRKNRRQRRGSPLFAASLSLCTAASLALLLAPAPKLHAFFAAIGQHEGFVQAVLSLETGLFADKTDVFLPPAISSHTEQPEVVESSTPAAPIASPQPESSLPVLGTADQAATLTIRNQTNYPIDQQALLSAEVPARKSTANPRVLIVHTHGSESYQPDAAFPFAYTENARTTDNRYNMIRVGAELKTVLDEAGIGAVHITELHDYPEYNGSYARSLQSIEQALAAHPDIEVVVDVHRDSILDQAGNYYRTVYENAAEPTAQLMLVVGTDQNGLHHPNWQQNLAFAAQLQQRLNREHRGLMRPLDLRTERFNQHATGGSILVEVGTSGNTLSEALAAVRLFGRALADDLGAKAAPAA